MKIAIISDAHGNYLSLLKVLKHASQHTNKIYFLGDAVGYFSESDKVIDTLIEYKINCIIGNHDAMLIDKLKIDPIKDKIYRIEISRKGIKKRNINFLNSLSTKIELDIDGIKILMVHGSPFNHLEGYIYPNTILEETIDFDYLFIGHTHHSFVIKQKKTVISNPGSCGLPRDNGNVISYILFDTLLRTLEIIKIKYNIDSILKHYSSTIHESVITVLKRNNIN